MKVVILAGGSGERLRPLTVSIPKALAPIDGIPVIKRQIDSLLDLGIVEIIVLTGYRSDMIEHYLTGIYKHSSANLTIVETPISFSPLQRLVDSKALIGSDFLLMYCDNFVTDTEALQSTLNSTARLTFLVEKRDIGNISIGSDVRYRESRSKDYPYVELGYMHIKSDLFFPYLEKSSSLQEAIEGFSNNFHCSVVITLNSNSSVSDILRFNKLRIKRKTILLDRDGVLNEKMPHRKYLTNFAEYKPIHSNLETLRSRFSDDTDFIVITNQPGIATGEVEADFLDFLHSKMIVEMFLLGISVIGIYVCNHHWEQGCDCRKPKPGMINQAIIDYNLFPQKIVYIGDEVKDMEAAEAAGIIGVRLTENPNETEFSTLESAYDVIQQTISM
jgi:histidinol-phosphate phosphatase family protein